MSSDKAMHAPGPMGWGRREDDLAAKHDKEKAARDYIASVAPQYLARRAAKPANEKMIARVVEDMRAAGVDGGFWFRSLERVTFGQKLRWLAQLIGSCVASGGFRCDVWRMLAEVFLLNDPEELFGTEIAGVNNVAPFAPYSYRAGRKIAGINGGSASGRDDGSLCLPHIQGKMQYGLLPCSTPGLAELSDALPEPQSEATYRQWGANDTLLNRFADFGRKQVLVESSPCKSANDVKIAIESFKPCQVCSSWAFKPKAQHPTWRLEDGSPVWIYTRDTRARWDHNMSLNGWCTVAGNEFTVVENSWPESMHKNGAFFVIDADEMDRWARDAEIQTIGEIDMSDNPPAFPVST